ncbi:MAG: prepilin-type N-terminal cleavage/methylation domain-containing protein [Acetobacteraceae bacterium]|nr:prepilin-type N-terminal cleavage/methylation domain-containing protein [Acetobacteraceae bacterium]
MRVGSAQRGFTLIEMIVVLAVLGLMLMLVLTHGPAHSERLTLEAATREVAGTLRVARARAIAQNRIVAVRLAPNGFQMDGDTLRLMPPALLLSGPSFIAFQPDGSSSGGSVAVQGGGMRDAIVVDWLTGRIRVGGGS